MNDNSVLVTLSVKKEGDLTGEIAYMISTRGERFFGRRIPWHGLSMLRDAYSERSAVLAGTLLWGAAKTIAKAWGGVEVKCTKHVPVEGDHVNELYLSRSAKIVGGKLLDKRVESFTGLVQKVKEVGKDE